MKEKKLPEYDFKELVDLLENGMTAPSPEETLLDAYDGILQTLMCLDGKVGMREIQNYLATPLLILGSIKKAIESRTL